MSILSSLTIQRNLLAIEQWKLLPLVLSVHQILLLLVACLLWHSITVCICLVLAWAPRSSDWEMVNWVFWIILPIPSWFLLCRQAIVTWIRFTACKRARCWSTLFRIVVLHVRRSESQASCGPVSMVMHIMPSIWWLKELEKAYAECEVRASNKTMHNRFVLYCYIPIALESVR